jgi:hypothetical protein
LWKALSFYPKRLLMIAAGAELRAIAVATLEEGA